MDLHQLLLEDTTTTTDDHAKTTTEEDHAEGVRAEAEASVSGPADDKPAGTKCGGCSKCTDETAATATDKTAATTNETTTDETTATATDKNATTTNDKMVRINGVDFMTVAEYTLLYCPNRLRENDIRLAAGNHMKEL